MRLFRTAEILSQPDRCRILSGMTFLPHQEAVLGGLTGLVPFCAALKTQRTAGSVVTLCLRNLEKSSDKVHVGNIVQFFTTAPLSMLRARGWVRGSSRSNTEQAAGNQRGPDRVDTT
jgi:hypothetical protein